MNPDGYLSDAEQTNVRRRLRRLPPGHRPDPDLRRRRGHPARVFLALPYAPRRGAGQPGALRADFARYGDGGFYDAVAVRSGTVSRTYLSLDQAMVMGALGNVLTGDLHRAFAGYGHNERRLRPLIGQEVFSLCTPRPGRRGRPSGNKPAGGGLGPGVGGATAVRARRVVLARPAAFAAVALVLGAVLFAASAPTPLYPVYQARFGFSPTTLTVVFAVYAVALIAALLLTGALSDRVGRRPVLLAAIGTLAAAMAVFALADSVAGLLAARVLQGIGTGVATGTLSAALLDLQPRPGAGPIVSTAAPSFGLAIGALLGGALVQHGPAPRQLVFWLLLAVFAAAAAAVLAVPETVPYDPGWLRAVRPRIGVPPAARSTFLLVGPLIGAAWALAGFYLSLGPSLAAQLAGGHDRLVGALPGVALFAAGGVASVLTTGWTRGGRCWPAHRCWWPAC